MGVAGRDLNQVIFCNCQINTLHGLRDHIPVALKALQMLFSVYTAAVACVTSL